MFDHASGQELTQSVAVTSNTVCLTNDHGLVQSSAIASLPFWSHCSPVKLTPREMLDVLFFNHQFIIIRFSLDW